MFGPQTCRTADSRYVAVADPLGGAVHVCEIKLSAKSARTVGSLVLQAGVKPVKPVDMALHPSGTLLYVLCDGTPTVNVLALSTTEAPKLKSTCVLSKTALPVGAPWGGSKGKEGGSKGKEGGSKGKEGGSQGKDGGGGKGGKGKAASCKKRGASAETTGGGKDEDAEAAPPPYAPGSLVLTKDAKFLYATCGGFSGVSALQLGPDGKTVGQIGDFGSPPDDYDGPVLNMGGIALFGAHDEMMVTGAHSDRNVGGVVVATITCF